MKNEILKILSDYTNHNHIKLTSKGNMSIYFAMYLAKKINSKTYFLIPEEGGWITYKKFPQMLKFSTQEIKTNRGIIDLEHLKEFAQKSSAFIYANPAGYFANQPIKEIYEICKEAGCIVILDASGSIGDKELCNGKYADFIVGSFSKWKPCNAEYGGFISSKDPFVDNDIFSIHKDCQDKYPIMLEKLKESPGRIKHFIDIANKIKNDLPDLDIIHRDKIGLNVVIAFKSQTEKEKIVNYCDDNNFEYTECPRYIRVNEDAISIEVKRL